MDNFFTMPLIAILRGIRPEEAADIGCALVEAGITFIEVPMNSPSPIDSIAALYQAVGQQATLGAGTVTKPASCHDILQAGGQLIISPHTDPAIIQQALTLGQIPMSGFFTPTEAFTAIQAGATFLKYFPATAGGTSLCKALKAVLPKNIHMLAVGGITPRNMSEFMTNGISGFGLGSSLYRAGDDAEKVYKKAIDFTTAYTKLKEKQS